MQFRRGNCAQEKLKLTSLYCEAYLLIKGAFVPILVCGISFHGVIFLSEYSIKGKILKCV